MPSWYLISDGVSKGGVFLSLLGASYLLGVSEYGQLVFYSLLVSGVGLQLGLKVHVAFEAFFSKLSEMERSDYFVGCAFITLTVSVLQYLIGLPFVLFLEFEYLPSMLIWALVNAVSLVLYLNQLFQTLFIMQEKYLRYFAVVVTNSIFFTSSFLYFCYNTGNGISYLHGYFFAGVCSLLLCLFLARDNLWFARQGVVVGLRKILGFCVGLIPHQLSNFFQGNLDRILVTIFFTKTDLGVYGLAQQVAQIFQLMVIAINKVYYPKAYSLLWKANKLTELREFFDWKRRFEIIFIGLGLICSLILPSVFFFLGEDYQFGKFISFILVLAFVFDAFYYMNSVILFKFERTRAISSISATLLLFYCTAGVLVGLYLDSVVFFALGTLAVFFLQSCVVRLVAYGTLRKFVTS